MYSSNTLLNANKDLQNCARKRANFFTKKQKPKTKRTKTDFCVNSPLVSKHLNFATENYAIKIFSALKTINLLFN